MAQEKISFKKEEVQKSPKDKIEEATITKLEKTTWRKYFETKYVDEKKREAALAKFDEPNQEIILIGFKTKTTNIEDTDTATAYNPIRDGTKLGKIIQKYGGLNEGTLIKVAFDGNGYPSILYK